VSTETPTAAEVIKNLPAGDQKILNEALVPAAQRDSQAIARILKTLSPADQAIVQRALDAVENRQQFIDRISKDWSADDKARLSDILRPVETPEEALDRIKSGLPSKDQSALQAAFEKATKAGFQLAAPSVNENVSIHAVMLPYDVCKSMFGGKIANRYAAIEVIVSNRSADAAMIVQNLYIDYSNWLLGGVIGGQPPPPLKPHESGIDKGHIASLDSRLVRGDLLNASVWSARNTVIRALQLAGSIAAAYQFSIEEKGIISGIAAFTGQVVPGVETFWPDNTIAQANRISDFGFQVNKVVGKQSAEIIVAFYPISRFLTPGVQDLLKRAPALLFTPGQMIFDNKTFHLVQVDAPELLSSEERTVVQNYLKCVEADHRSESRKQLCDSSTKGSGSNGGSTLLRFINSFSLNNVRVVVGGIMTVDVTSIPPAIQDITVTGGNTAGTWAQSGQVKAVVKGKYLTGASLNILEADKYGITDAAAVTTGSTDTVLNIQFTLTKPIPSDTVFTVTLSKKTTVDGAEKTLTSNPYLLKVSYPPPQPKITAVAPPVDGKVAITGADLFDANGTLAITLLPTGAAGLKNVTVSKDAITAKPTEIDIDLSKLGQTLQPACWQPQVSISALLVPGPTAFAQPQAVKIDSAESDGKKVTVKGSGFIDLKDCKSPLKFQVQNDTVPPQDATGYKLVSDKEVTLDSPDLSKGSWKVNAIVGDQQQATAAIKQATKAAAAKPAAPVPPAKKK
jgi:hypothetical protein